MTDCPILTQVYSIMVRSQTVSDVNPSVHPSRLQMTAPGILFLFWGFGVDGLGFGIGLESVLGMGWDGMGYDDGYAMLK